MAWAKAHPCHFPMPTVNYGTLNGDSSHIKNGFIGLLKILILKALKRYHDHTEYLFLPEL